MGVQQCGFTAFVLIFVCLVDASYFQLRKFSERFEEATAPKLYGSTTELIAKAGSSLLRAWNRQECFATRSTDGEDGSIKLS